MLLIFLDQCVDNHLCQWLPDEECKTERAKQDCPMKCGNCDDESSEEEDDIDDDNDSEDDAEEENENSDENGIKIVFNLRNKMY